MKFEKLLPPNSKRRNFIKSFYNKIQKNITLEEKLYNKWIKENEPNLKELFKQKRQKFDLNPKISIVVPLYNTPKKFLKELINCMFAQTYSNWELCLADGSPKSLEFIKKYIKKDKRIKYSIILENKGISENTNEALKLATGEFIGLLDHDDILPKFSLYEVVKTINENPKVEFIYSDEDKFEKMNGQRYGVFFKPDFSPYTLNSANYICHFSVFKKELMNKLKEFRKEYDGSQDFDIVARASELTNNIVHIPKVLYHWRAHKNSTAQNSDSKPYAYEIGKAVIKDHIKRNLDTDVEVKDGLTPGSYEVKYLIKKNTMVSIILDAVGIQRIKALKLIDIIRRTSYKNYEILVISNEFDSKFKFMENNVKIIKPIEGRFNNLNNAISQSNGAYFMIVDENLNEIENKNFIEDLVGICQDDNVGIVGTKLYNEKGLIEHCGLILGMNGIADFIYRGVPKNSGTYMQRLMIIHNLSCEYVKYAMIDRKVYNKIDGFSKNFDGLLVSIDICLKMLNQKKQVVINPNVSIGVKQLSDIEINSNQINEFMKKWEKYYNRGDAFFSPNLSKTNTGISINVD